MTSDAPTVAAPGDRVRITREGVVTAVWDGGFDFDTDAGGNFTVSNRFPAEVEVLAAPAPPLFVDGDLVASETTEGNRVLRIRKGGQWFFVDGPTAGKRSWLLDREIDAAITRGRVWRIDTDKPVDAEPAPAPPFAFDDEGHEVGKTYTNHNGGTWQLTPAHEWLCVTPSPTLGHADEVGQTMSHIFPERPLTEVTT